jgi:hypothetical protein
MARKLCDTKPCILQEAQFASFGAGKSRWRITHCAKLFDEEIKQHEHNDT